jgi:hypothetical protein
MTLPAFVILVLLAFLAATIFLELAAIPGKQARERGHPQADAINILGWVGLLLGFAPWVVALVWAYTRPGLLAPTESGHRLAAPSPPLESAEDSDA